MTQREIDEKTFEKKSYIADKFKDIQVISQNLTTPDSMDWETQIKKIQDAVADALRVGAELKDLEAEYPDPEEDEDGEDNGYGSYL